jgi:hypothetical protein
MYVQFGHEVMAITHLLSTVYVPAAILITKLAILVSWALASWYEC